MARYPSGIAGPLPGDDIDDVRARLARMTLEMEHHPIGESAPCSNPECTKPVDYLGNGPLPLYCSNRCRSRVTFLRQKIAQQLALIERTLDDAKGLQNVPRSDLRSRARKLRWWQARLLDIEEKD